ncbi:hypothetical protein KJ762_01145 [bacterium]|nr:hypothetical protein [bacterium]MBU1066042.1 hypothetical protein [bacterium]MBU1633094.1 hypothetical protein [bacterium]MBU1874286.1 hypothetical protein [bacterium]
MDREKPGRILVIGSVDDAKNKVCAGGHGGINNLLALRSKKLDRLWG